MKQLLKRPLAFAGISFYLVSFLLVRADTGLKTAVITTSLAMLAAAVIASFIFIRHRGLLSATALVFVFIMLASGLSYYFYDIKPAQFSFTDGEAHRITAEAGDVYSSSSYGSRQLYKVKTVDGEEASLRLLIEMDSPSVNPGELAEFSAVILPLADEYSGSEYSGYLSDGILFCASPADMTVSADPHPSLSSLSLRLSSKLSGILCSALGYENGGFASAVLLGNKSFLETDVKLDFMRLGIAHLLAISGIHLTIIAVYLSSLIRRLTGSETAGEAAKIVISAGYSVLAGLSMSVVRSAVMLSVSSVGRIISRRSDSATSLAIAIVGILLFNPYAAGSISLLLSFSSILGIMFCDSMLSGRMKTMRGIKYSFVKTVSFSAFIFAVTLPASWLYFDEISVLSPISNLLFIPLVTIILTLLPVLLIISPFTGLYLILSKPVSALISVTLLLAERFGKLRGITVSTAIRTFPAVVGIIICALVTSAFLDRPKRKYCGIAVAAAVFVLFASVAIIRTSSADCTDIVMTSHKNSDEIIVISDNKTMLIDVSDGSYSSVYPAIKAMRNETYCELDSVMLTHLHSRHISTMRKLMRQMRLSVLILPLPISETDQSVYDSLTALADASGCEVVCYDRQAPDLIRFAACMISPTEYVMLSRSTHPVITFSVSAGRTFAYLGGASNEPELSGITERLMAADIICFGAHSPIYKLPLTIGGQAYYSIGLISTDSGTAISPDAIPYSEDEYAKVRLSGK